MNDKVIKLFTFNLAIAIIVLAVISNGILNAVPVAGIFKVLLSLGFFAIVFVIFMIGNIMLIYRGSNEKESNPASPSSYEDSKEAVSYMELLNSQYGKRGLKKYVDMQIEQIKRFERKDKTARALIAERFQATELTYGKFNGAIDDASAVFYSNLNSVVNKMAIFDGEEYNNLRRKTYTVKAIPQSVKDQIAVLEGYLTYIQSAIESNETVMVKLDKLILEISQLTTLSDEEMKNRSELKDLDEFIEQIKLYKKA